MKKHFVIFYSPGTFVAEWSEKPIDSWDVEKAKEMAHVIIERHAATPYGFRFTTRERKGHELDSKQVKQSGMYFLGGRLLTLGDVEREMPTETILQSNMRGNKIDFVCVNENSWRTVQPFKKDDVLLEWSPKREGKTVPAGR